MPDPSVAIALLALVALVEATSWVRLPIGLLLAIALLASGAELLPVAMLGAAGVMIARLWLALDARRGRDRLGSSSPHIAARREAMRRQLSESPAYARMTFLLAALPAIPAGFIFPLLGAMRAPLWPALLGTLVGRTPLLALTSAVFAWLGRLGASTDQEGALTLGILAALLLAFRSLALVDWRHRAETGSFRLRDPDEHAARLTAMFGPRPHGASAAGDPTARQEGHETVEGEVIGEETEDEPSDDDDPPAALPPTGLAPS